ncbi:hypothetical protein P879_03454, partial [Paragonimus westermani]
MKWLFFPPKVFAPPDEDPYYVECFYSSSQEHKLRIPVYLAPSHDPNDPPIYERFELRPYDQINCSERARFADVWGFSDDGLELIVSPGQAPTMYTFDKLHPYQWRVKKFPAGGQWRLGCRLDNMVPRWMDVVVK